MDGAGSQITGCARRCRIQGPPQPPAFLAPQPRAQKRRRAPQRQAPMWPMIHGAAPHLPGIPTAPHQQRRLLRVRLGAGVAQMALHPHPLATAEKPRPPRVAAVLDRQRAPAGRAALPVPGRASRQFPQRLRKSFATFDNVHGLGDSLRGFLITTAWSHSPFLSRCALALPDQHDLEPSRLDRKCRTAYTRSVFAGVHRLGSPYYRCVFLSNPSVGSPGISPPASGGNVTCHYRYSRYGDRGRCNICEVGLRRPNSADAGRFRDGCSGS